MNTAAAFDGADRRHMARALELARAAVGGTRPNPAVGCVLVRGGRVVGEGATRPPGGPHAEVVALAAAGAAARNATAYVTLEPCAHHGRTPPCADALIAAGVARVVAAVVDPDPRTGGAGLARLRAAGIETATGLSAAEAEAVNAGFLERHRTGRPRVVVKLAASLDGRTAAADGTSQWITGTAARDDVQRLRALAGAIVTGSGTLVDDDPALTVRRLDGPLAAHRAFIEAHPPLRVVVGRRGPAPGSRLLAGAGPVLWARPAGPREAPGSADSGARPEILALPGQYGDGTVDLRSLLRALGARQVNDVLVEAGPRLAGAFLGAGLAHELVLYLAPRLLGDGGRPLAHLPGLRTLGDAIPLRWTSVDAVGDDVRLVAVPGE